MSKWYVAAPTIGFWQSFASQEAANTYLEVVQSLAESLGRPASDYCVLPSDEWLGIYGD